MAVTHCTLLTREVQSAILGSSADTSDQRVVVEKIQLLVPVTYTEMMKCVVSLLLHHCLQCLSLHV